MKDRIDVCYLISHGFASRMIFQTGLLERLVEQGKKVAVIAPDREDPNLVEYCAKQGVELYEFRAPNNLFTVDYMFRRKYFLEDIRNNPGLWAKHLRAVYGTRSLNPYFRLRPYWYFWTYKLIGYFPGIRERFRKQENRILDYDKAVEVIDRVQPALVVATYPVNLPESMLLKAAQKRGRATAIHLLSWDNITCKGAFPALADYYIAWGPVMKEEFQEYYDIPEERIFSCGVPHFDMHYDTRQAPDYQEYLRDLGLEPQAPYLFVAMSSPNFAPLGMDIIEWLAAKVRDNAFDADLQLIVRPHPQNVQGSQADLSWLPRLEAVKGPRVAIDYPSVVESQLPWSMQDHDMKRLSNLLAGAAVTLNYGSTVAIDALMVDKPAIVIAFDGEEELPWWQSGRRQMEYVHYRKLIELGGVRVAYSYDQLDEHLRYYLEYPDGDLDVRQQALYQECGENDGQATKRVAAALSEILEAIYEPVKSQS